MEMTASKHFSLRTHAGRVGSDYYFSDFELNFPPQKITVILGSSGIGKSTLLRAILGELTDSTLKVHSPFSEVAWMAQQDLLMPWLNVLENVLLGYHLRGVCSEEHRQKALLLLERMGLSAFFKEKPYRLSGGMRQRVALARTLMEEAPLILMDEPFSALDSVNRHHLQNLTAENVESMQKTVVMVTHDPKEALRLGHQIIVLGGFPARVYNAMSLDSKVPRDIDSEEVTALEPKLLKCLLSASEAS
jgi:putative hydroxymethylpyrimidine transport system ATP-binding protein